MDSKWQEKFEHEKTQVIDDDYEVCKAKVDWNDIPEDVATEEDINQIRLIAGGGDEILAPEGDLSALFGEPSTAQPLAHSFLKVLTTRDPPKLRYFLTLLSHVFENEPSRGKVFLNVGQENIVQTFSRVWNREDLSEFTRGKAAICGSYILRWSDIRHRADLQSMVNWILDRLRSTKNDSLLLPLYALKGIITNVHFQELFSKDKGIDRLYTVLEQNSDHRQVVYLVVFCLWALSFQRKYANHDNLLNGQLVARLVKLVQSKMSNKSTRVILQLFENLLDRENFNEMVVIFGLYPTLEGMEEEKTEDEEQKTCITRLLDSLAPSVKILSSVERYETELASDKLSWGACHTEHFWKKYSTQFDDDQFKLIKRIIVLLRSHEPETVAVACYDLGEWSRFYPDGSKIVSHLGAKDILMRLIEHKDPSVQKHALTSLQKILIRNWQALGTDQGKDKK